MTWWRRLWTWLWGDGGEAAMAQRLRRRAQQAEINQRMHGREHD